MAQEFSNDALVGLATISAGLGVLVTKLAETVVKTTINSLKRNKEEDNAPNSTIKQNTNTPQSEHQCKQEGTIAGIGVSVGIYGKRIEDIEKELAKMREHTREDNQLQREEYDKLRLAISEVKDIVHSVEITISQVTTVLKILENE